MKINTNDNKISNIILCRITNTLKVLVTLEISLVQTFSLLTTGSRQSKAYDDHVDCSFLLGNKFSGIMMLACSSFKSVFSSCKSVCPFLTFFFIHRIAWKKGRVD